MTKLKANQIPNPATIPVPLDQCLNCGERIYQIQDTRSNVNSPKLSTAVVAFDSFVRNSRTQVFMRDALKEIYGLLYLVQLNKDSDGCALCVDCCLVFAQLYGLFHTFESRRKSDGFLGSTLKLAFKSFATGSCIVPAQVAEEIDNNEKTGASHQAAMETDPSDSFIVIQRISSKKNSSNEDDNDGQDVDMLENFDTPASPDPASDQDVEMPQNVDSDPASPVDLDPASPVNSGPASPVNNDPASPVHHDPSGPVQSEPDPEELNPLESPVAPSPPVSPGAPKNLKLKPKVCIFKCIDCIKTFQSSTELGKHRVKAHKAEYPFACHLCSYKTKNSSILKPHVVRHSAPWNLKCKICKRLFRLKNDLRHHLRRAHKLTNFITEHYMEGETPVQNVIRKSSARGQINKASAAEEGVAGNSQEVKSEKSSKKSANKSKKSDDSEDDDDSKSNNGGSESNADAAANDDKSNGDSESESSSSNAASDASSDSSDSENEFPEKSKPSRSKRPRRSKVSSPKPPKKSVQVTYKCTDCPEEFTDLPVFTQHRQKIHDKSGSEIYKCHCCLKLFGAGYNLTLHLTRQAKSGAVNQEEDTSKYLFQCLDCSQKFKSPAALGRHRKDVHGSLNLYVCHHCHYTTFNSSLLKPHVLRHIVTASLKCPKCDKYFKLKADVAGHMRKTHKIRRIVRRFIHNEPGKPTVMAYLCRKCDKEFDSQQDLIQHRKIAHGDKETFHCDICGALFFAKYNLTSHMMRHKVESKHKCSHCDKTFYELSSKKLHEDTIHALKPVFQKDAFKCPNCGMSFGSVEGLEAHHESKHIGNKRKGTYVCDQCGMPFETKLKLTGHWIAVHKSKQCPHCDVKVPLRELTVHIKAKHPDQYGPYSKKKAKEVQSGAPPKDVQLHCCDCAAIFPTMFSLRHHRQDSHGTPEDQMMTCHLCKQVYKQEIGFVTHVGNHNEGSDWPCAHCPMRFTKRLHRNLHNVRDHGMEDDKDALFPVPPEQELECRQGSSSSGGSKVQSATMDMSNDPKPYKCLECDAEFVRAQQLGIHRTIAHGCKNEERYQCHVCHQFYKTDTGLSGHMPRHTNERDQLCESCGKGFKMTADLVQHYQLNHTEDGSKHLREKWKRWRDKKSRENRASKKRRKVEESDEDGDSDTDK